MSTPLIKQLEEIEEAYNSGKLLLKEYNLLQEDLEAAFDACIDRGIERTLSALDAVEKEIQELQGK